MQKLLLNIAPICMTVRTNNNSLPRLVIKEQRGFTLVELMIALVLGLLISAAAVQIYLTNARTSTVQKSGSELQDASVFGVQLLENHLRLANLGNTTTKVNDTTPNGGIVISATNLTVAPAYLTNSDSDTDWTGISNTNVASDQLTIQFKNTTNAAMSDCEGADIAVNTSVVERYFLRSSTGGTGLVMACDAGRVVGNTATSFGTGGQEFINNVDQFKVLLVTQDAAGLQAYVTPHAYKALPSPKPNITAVKVGLIVRGSTATVGTAGQSTFTLLGQTNTLNNGVSNKYIRNTYESTTLLRNARPAI